MTTPVVAALIAFAGLLCTVLGLAAGALWRLGTRMATSEAAVKASDAAGAKWTADVLAVLRELSEQNEEFKRRLTLGEAQWREAHGLTAKVNNHETRLAVVECMCKRNHPPRTSGPHVIEEGAPEDLGPFDDDEEGHR